MKIVRSIRPSDISKNNAYQYKWMCFGLSGAPATWCRLVQTALSGIEGVYAYMDDLLLHSTTLDDHKKLIDQVLHRLSYHGIEISLKKCQWVQEKVEYLGFSVTSRGLTTQRKLLDPMIATPLPKTLKEARSLISTFSFYRRFIRGFSDIAHPLIQLTKGYPVGKGEHIPIETTPECKEALEKLKGKLKESVVLKYPDFSKKFIVNTDASLRGIGGALSQLDKDGHPRPLGFVSRSLTPTEARYPVVELEALALVYALKQFRPIILGYETELVTDHRPLVYLFRHVDPNSRLYRYQLAIQEFNIVGIEYITGQSNIVSDYLSRWSFQPDDDLAPAIACSLHSPLASTPPALFDYEKGQEVEIAEGNMLAFTSNTRNTQGFLQDGAIPDQEVILKQMYEGRKAVTPDIPVATKDTASSLGQVSYQRRNGMQYALCFTDVLETPEQASEKQKLLRSIRENEALKQEGFKFQLRNDKGPIRDYYFMLCLEKLAGECQQRKVRKLQIVWPKAQEESAKRVRHISSLIRHCAYELSQQDSKCEVLQQSEIEVTDRDFIISALTVREAKAETEVKMKQHLAKFQKYQEEDPSFKAIIQSLKTGKPQEEHCLREGLLYRVETSASRGEVRRLCVPTRLRQDIMKEYHERDHHPGVAKTYYNCRSQCHWDNMRKDIKEHVIKCTICAQAKHSNNKRVLEGHLVIPPDAGHTYAIDIVGSLPKAGQYRKILVIVCTFSRFTAAAPLSAGSAVEVINALEKIFPLMGYPAQIVSDNAGNFTSDYFLDYLKGKGIEHQLTTPYTPTGNALAERSIRSVLSLLRVMCGDKPKDWNSYLGQVCMAINEGFNLTTRERPFFLFHGRDPRPRLLQITNSEVPKDEKYYMVKYARELVAKELKKDHERRDKKMLSSGRLTSYKVADIVYLQRRFVGDPGYKLKYPYLGPYRVKEVAGNTVVLESLTTGKTRRASMRHLKIYKDGTLTRTQNRNVDRVFPEHEPLTAEEPTFEGILEPLGEGEDPAVEAEEPSEEDLEGERYGISPKPPAHKYHLRSRQKAEGGK